MISWHVPYRVTPLLDSSFKVLEMHMGINGQRLDAAQMSMRGYRLATTEFHIIIEIPIGAPDGYYKVAGSLGCMCERPGCINQVCVAESRPRLPVSHHICCGAHA